MKKEHIILEKNLILDKSEGVATITLNNPDALNALNESMNDEIIHYIETDFNYDDDSRVLVFTGGDAKKPAFCSGFDVRDLTGPVGMPVHSDAPGKKGLARRTSEFRKLIIPHARLILILQKVDKPVIAAVNGVTAGSGLALALACDIRIASESARFTTTWSRIGCQTNWGVTWFLPRLVGIEKALELAWTSEILGASEAERIGLVSKVVPENELMPAVMELAGKLVKGPPLAMQMNKRTMLQGLGMTLEQTLYYENWVQKGLLHTEDATEGVQSFLEKRPPEFKGK